MSKKYISKPKKIEAIKFEGTYKSYDEILSFVGSVMAAKYHEEDNVCHYIRILTKFGTKIILEGFYVTKDLTGGYDVFNQNVFEKEYDLMRINIKCGWMLESDGDYYMTACDCECKAMEDEEPINGFKFCPFCGKEIIIDEGGE